MKNQKAKSPLRIEKRNRHRRRRTVIDMVTQRTHEKRNAILYH